METSWYSGALPLVGSEGVVQEALPATMRTGYQIDFGEGLGVQTFSDYEVGPTDVPVVAS